MYPNETFRGVQQVHRASGSLAHRLAQRNSKARGGVPKRSGRESQQARPETWQQKAESSYAFRFRPRANRYLESCFRFFVFLRRQFGIRQPLSHDLLTQQTETVRVVHRIVLRGAIVEPERLFIYIPEQVERFNSNVSSTQSALEQTPEVFHALSVHLPVYILLKVVNKLVLVLAGKSVVALKLVGHNRGTLLNEIAHSTVNGGVLAISDDSRLNLASTLKCADDHGLAVTALHSNTVAETAALRLVHIACLAANESLINLYCAVRAAQLAASILVLHSEPDAMQHKPCCLLRNSQRAVNLPRGNAILAVRNHPHDREPLLKTERRVLKDRASLDRELRLRIPRLALPQTARAHKRYVLASARRAGNAVLPAANRQVVEAVIGVLEVDDCVG